MTSSGRQDGGQGWKWSEPVSLHEAVSRSPVLIRLEEGHRGVQEDLSFSAGDMMALEGLKEVRGRRLVLAHYTSDLEVEEGGGGEQAGVYRALLTLAYDSLPHLDVSMLQDPGGHDYRNFVDRHFHDCNWARQQDQLLENMDEQDYVNVNIITTTPGCQTSSSKELWQLQKKPPPPKTLPKPRRLLPGRSDTGSPGELTPPPRPPKPGARSGPSTARAGPSTVGIEPSTFGAGPSTATARPGDQGPQLPPDKPPPRPPRGRVSAPPPVPAPRERHSDLDDFSMPTIAELTSGQGFCCGDTQELSAEPQMAGKETSKEKPTKESTLHKLKLVGKKVYTTIAKAAASHAASQLDNPHSPTTASNSEEGNYVEIIDDDDDDNSDMYEEIDETMMIPSLAEPPSGKTDGKSKKEKEAAKKQAVRPTVRVHPQRVGGMPLTSHPVSPSSESPKAHLSVSPAADQDLDELGYAPQTPASPASVLERMTCDELCSRLQKCGWPRVAQICKERLLDGAFFDRLSNDTLMKPPFSLDQFEVNSKLRMIKAGWVPT